jgi:hypothetical protein
MKSFLMLKIVIDPSDSNSFLINFFHFVYLLEKINRKDKSPNYARTPTLAKRTNK